MPKNKTPNTGKGSIFLRFLAAFLLLAGCILLLYPRLNSIWAAYRMRRNAEDFLSYVDVTIVEPERDSSYEAVQYPEEAEETLPEQYPELWQQMKAYNEAIFRESQEGLSGKTAYETPSFTLADYGLDSEVFAVLSIPALGLTMPVYLGATRQHMADGAAVMGQTSLPLGGGNTNCVIAGHRGWNGAAYFLYLPQLKKGDIVTITNLWETLTYEVVETKIIAPNDVEAIHIQPNRELVTLLTCHPPASGGKQRYLVVCERTYL